MILYKTPTSATDKSADIIILLKYQAGNAINVRQ